MAKKVMYRVFYTESERDWGQNHWSTDYDTFEEAKIMRDQCNQRNSDNFAQTHAVPDYYIQASDRIEVVEI